MDLDEFRSILISAGVDVWTLIETAITVASTDYGNDFKNRRDRIVEQLYAPAVSRCRNCDRHVSQKPNVDDEAVRENRQSEERGKVRSEKESSSREDEDRMYGSPIDEEQRKILAIKEHLEDHEQSEESLVDLLQSLADMDITFNALKETDIGRHVNRLRKHSSNEVRRLVKQLVRKWKDLVDEWVKLNTPAGETAPSTLVADGDSPQQSHNHKSTQMGHHHVPDFSCSPYPHNGNSGSDKYHSDPEQKPRVLPRREAPTKPTQAVPVSASITPNKQKEEKESLADPEKLALARRRLHENYQDAQNAKKQRTIQVMDLHEIPKPKNTFFAKNRGGVQARHW
ncbi:hypothetical protein L1049_026484 [Liquidambar formosana]|uniref:TFIIS N-terminal domain-containing protein n=1 Tax=Liquidambar formosana TaxID=63359 RepID=A0AAP0R7X5_LIQFO